MAIELCRILNLELGVSMQQGAAICASALPAASHFRYETVSGLVLQLELESLRRRVTSSLLDVVESTPASTRGRPGLRRGVS